MMNHYSTHNSCQVKTIIIWICIHIENRYRRKIKLFARALKQLEKLSFWELFCPVSQRMEMNFIFIQQCQKANKTTVKLSKKSRKKRRSNRFYGVLCEVSSCTATV
jgi:uncharacterized membrane protein